MTLYNLVNISSSKDILDERLIQQPKKYQIENKDLLAAFSFLFLPRSEKPKKLLNSDVVITFHNIVVSCNDLQIQDFNKFP